MATLAEAPAFRMPLYVPLNVCTVAPAAVLSASVIACAPLAEPTFPWLVRLTVNATALPALGLPGLQDTVPTRSELGTALTTSVPVAALLALLVSTTVFASSTTARTAYEPAARAPMLSDTFAVAP